MERSVILSSGPVLHLSLPYPILTSRNATPKVRTLAEAEREHILQALQDNDWIIGGRDGASAQLGVKRTTLLDKMRRHGISRPKPDGLLSAI
jgi:transcriptional regulator of acetoin/glycerol metabolism